MGEITPDTFKRVTAVAPQVGFTPDNFKALVDATGLPVFTISVKLNIGTATIYRWLDKDNPVGVSEEKWERAFNMLADVIAKKKQRGDQI
jgi:hypothetical protein